MLPSDGCLHRYQYSVLVIKLNNNTRYAAPCMCVT